MAKKKDPRQQIDETAVKIRETISRWNSHKENGCSDPTWPDGANMNLLRNHVFSYKRQIRDLCAEHEKPLRKLNAQENLSWRYRK